MTLPYHRTHTHTHTHTLVEEAEDSPPAVERTPASTPATATARGSGRVSGRPRGSRAVRVGAHRGGEHHVYKELTRGNKPWERAECVQVVLEVVDGILRLRYTRIWWTCYHRGRHDIITAVTTTKCSAR